MRSHTDLWGSEVRFDLLWAKRWSARRFYIGEATTKKKSGIRNANSLQISLFWWHLGESA